MIDGISAKTLSGGGGTPRVGTVAAASPVRTIVRQPAGTTASPTASPTEVTVASGAATGGLARTLAATPPVDADRVALIKRAIADGQFPILPAKIADSLIAMKLQWMSDDKA